METHRLLSLLGLVLLIATAAIFYFDDEKPQDEFSFAYVTGIAMIIVFLASLALINKDVFKKSKK